MDNYPNFSALPYEGIQSDNIVAIVAALQNEVPHLLQELNPLSLDKPIFRVDIETKGERNDSTYSIFHCLSLSSKKPKRVIAEAVEQNEKFLAEIKQTKLILPDASNNESTILYLLSKLLVNLNYTWYMVYMPEMKVKIFNDKHLNITLPAFLQVDKLLAGEVLDEFHILDILKSNLNFDLDLFYRAIFRALKKQKFEFEYRSPDFEVVIDCIRNCKVFLEEIAEGKKSEKKYKEELKDLNKILKSMKIYVEDPLDEDAVCAGVNEFLPKKLVNLYFDVYGKYPNKYPLRAIDY